jgi:hypothetical protein
MHDLDKHFLSSQSWGVVQIDVPEMFIVHIQFAWLKFRVRVIWIGLRTHGVLIIHGSVRQAHRHYLSAIQLLILTV